MAAHADVARLGNAKHDQALLSRLEASDSAPIRIQVSSGPGTVPEELEVSGSPEAPTDPGPEARAKQLSSRLFKLLLPEHPALIGAICCVCRVTLRDTCFFCSWHRGTTCSATCAESRLGKGIQHVLHSLGGSSQSAHAAPLLQEGCRCTHSLAKPEPGCCSRREEGSGARAGRCAAGGAT